MFTNRSKESGQRSRRTAEWRERFNDLSTSYSSNSESDSLKRDWTWLRAFRNRAICAALILIGLFLVYRAVWLTSWYWPYRLLHQYFSEQLPMAAPWLVGMLATLVALLIFAQGATVLSFVLWGKHRREMLGLALAGVLLHGALGWYGHSRVAVDDKGRVVMRVVESPSGELKVIDRDFDPVTGRRARIATEVDLVMLDLQRRGMKVRRIGKSGPFRTAQGTINVYYTSVDGRLTLYNGPRHPEVSGDMRLATDTIISEYLRQR